MSKHVRVLLALVSVILYILAFVLTYPFEGDIAGMWTILPAVISGWLLGIPTAFVFGLLTIPSNLMLFGFVGSPAANLLVYHAIGGVACAAIGVATGWVKGVVDQSREQVHQLERERATLRAEIAKREQAEEALRQSKANLESTVMERTNQLKQANAQLQIELAEHKTADEKNRQYIAQLESLRQIGLEITAELDLDTLLRSMAGRVNKLMGGLTSSIWMYRPERDSLERVINLGPYLVNSAPVRKRGEGLIGKVWASGKPMIVNDYGHWDNRNTAYDSAPSRNVMGVPLKWGDQILGVANIVAEPRRVFTEVDVELMNLFAMQASIAIHNAQLFQSAQQEIAERKRAEERLVHNALHDPLTDLPNRALFMDRLNHALERAQRRQDYLFAVLYLDLDRFKVVNDSLGHNIGDQLLIESARRLSACLRTLDTVARLGGDEFVILLEDIQGITEATEIADRIQHDLALPFDSDQHNVFVSISLGIVLRTKEYDRSEDILRDAETAMYRAKALGRGRYEVFDPTMRDRAMTRLELETDLRMALERHEFLIHYQPIVSLRTRKIVGFEALVRWGHPSRGLVAPAEFIPVAEETGLIVLIDHWVLFEACRQMREWQARFPANPPLTISVNLSAKQFGRSDLVQKIAQVLQETGLDTSSLKLELTESMIIEDSEAVSTLLSQLRTLGVEVQIDDFGTGYSSLGYLHRLPIDTLKIDRTFIGKIGANGNGTEIVRTILVLAHDLGMKVIAEGVETADQLTKLIGLDCEYGQGFLFAKPVDGQGAAALIAGVSVAA